MTYQTISINGYTPKNLRKCADLLKKQEPGTIRQHYFGDNGEGQLLVLAEIKTTQIPKIEKGLEVILNTKAKRLNINFKTAKLENHSKFPEYQTQ